MKEGDTHSFKRWYPMDTIDDFIFTYGLKKYPKCCI